MSLMLIIGFAVLGMLNVSGCASVQEVEVVRFAAVGDYGGSTRKHQKQVGEVAELIKSWKPDFIITLGDNGYSHGTLKELDNMVGRYYHEFIGNYRGRFGKGADVNRFFPSPGDHDWPGRGEIVGCDRPNGPDAYLEFFSLPGNERYYDFRRGPVHLFALNSKDCREPDGTTKDSKQAQWLRDTAAKSDAPFKIAYFHHTPWTSGQYTDDSEYMRWPFREWGIDVVIAGHDHTYERVQRDGVIYITNGLGGRSYREFGEPIRGGQVRFTGDFGAMLIEASENRMIFKFITRKKKEIDIFTLDAAPSITESGVSTNRGDVALDVEKYATQSTAPP